MLPSMTERTAVELDSASATPGRVSPGIHYRVMLTVASNVIDGVNL